MSNAAFVFGAFSFLCCVMLQMLVWNVVRVRRPAIQLAGVVIILPFIAYILIFWFGNVAPIEVWSGAALHFLLGCAYLQSYPVFQCEDIPSFKILRVIEGKGGNSVTESAILDAMSEDRLFSDKLEDLTIDGLVVVEGEWVRLTKSGKCLLWFFVSYRRWLGLDSGRG